MHRYSQQQLSVKRFVKDVRISAFEVWRDQIRIVQDIRDVIFVFDSDWMLLDMLKSLHRNIGLIAQRGQAATKKKMFFGIRILRIIRIIRQIRIPTEKNLCFFCKDSTIK
jgi:hypothetical protein